MSGVPPGRGWGEAWALSGPAHTQPSHPSLRAPKAPDATADMGRHEFTYALMPHKGEGCGRDASEPVSGGGR